MKRTPSHGSYRISDVLLTEDSPSFFSTVQHHHLSGNLLDVVANG